MFYFFRRAERLSGLLLLAAAAAVLPDRNILLPAGRSCTGDAGFSTGVLTCLAWDRVVLGVIRSSGFAVSGWGSLVLDFALLERVVRVGMLSSLVTGSGCLDVSPCEALARERVVRVLAGIAGTTGSTPIFVVTLFLVADLKL